MHRCFLHLSLTVQVVTDPRDGTGDGALPFFNQATLTMRHLRCFRRSTMNDAPHELRQRLRTLRRALPPALRQQAAVAVAGRLTSWSVFATANRIAAYWARDGELSPMPLLEYAWAANQQVYLPVLTDTPLQSLQFTPYRPDTPLHRNRFSIPEPDVSPTRWLEPPELDLVLMPLVAFDSFGNRLGMGGGFYDRSFAFQRDPSLRSHRPYLIGLSYEFQKVATLFRQPWDVPLDATVTEAALYGFSGINGWRG